MENIQPKLQQTWKDCSAPKVKMMIMALIVIKTQENIFTWHIISFSMSVQSSWPAASSCSMMSQYLSAIMLSVPWSQHPNCSYWLQNSRCHGGLKGGLKSRHWGWADAGLTKANSITGTIRITAGSLGIFLDGRSCATARKTAQPARLGWSAASLFLVIFAFWPRKNSVTIRSYRPWARV